jgi:hypothetical protein
MPLPPRLASDSREHAPLRRTLDKTEQGFAAVNAALKSKVESEAA